MARPARRASAPTGDPRPGAAGAPGGPPGPPAEGGPPPRDRRGPGPPQGRGGAHALAERRRRGPAEVRGGALAADGRAGVVAAAGRREGQLDVADDVADGLRDLADRRVLGADEVVRPAGGDRGERPHDPFGKVLDVDEAAALRAVARDGQRLAGERPADEGGDDRRGSRARAVGDAEAQDRVLDAVELAV